ncbi:hypothetical protein MKX01_010017 [Papaver californicum]|nr:hypothetical protein MKX01_010017 [Papaver californicum]
MARLVAGTTLRGEFEERLIVVIDEVKRSEENVIFFIDEVHTLMGEGGHHLDAANFLKPPLARGELKCIGATMLWEFNKFKSSASAGTRFSTGFASTEQDIKHVVSYLTGIPLEKVSSLESERVLNIENILLERVIDQKEAARDVARTIFRARTGINYPYVQPC